MARLTAEMLEAFSGVYLSPRYDQPQPTPPFHRECWGRYCSPDPACATAAPRNHAKSTGLTHDYILANVCFRDEDYVILVGSSEDLAIEHLGDIANELRENEALRRDFKIKGFIQEQKTDIIVECTDGHQFRIVARGAEQKIRGRKWRGKRPGLIVGDDLEDDEQVENKDRRKKFRRWFFRACKQALRDGGRIRIHGTILHEDSLLSHLIRNKQWKSRCYRAHKSFSDFSEILWPDKFPEERLRAIRQEFINENDSGGYSQEYLNDPQDNNDQYLRKEDFIPMADEDYDIFKVRAVGVDFMAKKADTSNRASFTVGGRCIRNLVHIEDQYVDRMDSLEQIEMFFTIHARWNPDVFFVEDGQIWQTMWPMLQTEMRRRDIWLNCEPLKSTQDKAVRGRTWQKKHKSGGMRYNKRADWYPEYEQECTNFRADTEATLDDQFDSTSILCRGLEHYQPVEEEDAQTEEERLEEIEAYRARGGENQGRSQTTGY